MNKSKRTTLAVGLTCALMMLIIMLPSMIKNHGIYIIRGDYVDQYLTRLYKAKEILSQGLGTWDWYNLLGAPYNGIGPILALDSLCLLLPKGLIPYGATLMHLFRFGLIGITAFSYLRYMVKEEKHAFLGAILYTFSSYTFINLEFMQFMEGLWAFPLLLLAVERMFRSENYRNGLIAAVFLSAISSFYLFVFSTISFALYFLCRFFLAEEWRKKRRPGYFLKAMLEYAIGFACALFAALPYLYRLFDSAGSADAIGSSFDREWIYDRSLFSRLFAFFVPAASNRFNVFGMSGWRSIAAYVPVFGVSFAVATLFNKKQKNRGWVIALCVLGALTVLSSGVSIVYNMFSSTYTRHAYGAVLFFVLATLMFIESYDARAARLGTGLTLGAFGLVTALYYLCYYRLSDNSSFIASLVNTVAYEEDINRGMRLYALLAAVLFCALLIGFLASKAIRRHALPLIAALITLYGCTYTAVNVRDAYFLDYYPSSALTLSEQTEIYFGEQPSLEDGRDYRIDFPKQFRNYAYVAGKPSLSVFESVRNAYTAEMTRYLGYFRGKVSIFPTDDGNALRTLLGVKYYCDLYPKDGIPVPEGFVYKETSGGVNIYENENYLGMGFSYNCYLTRSQFEDTHGRDKAALMLGTLIIEDDDEDYVAGLMKNGQGSIKAERVLFDSFETTVYGFKATVSTEEDKVMYVSVPYEDEGWTALINGKRAEFIRANVGCMAFKVEAGLSQIEFTYRCPADKRGLYGSFAGLAALGVYLTLCGIRKKRASVAARSQTGR